MIYVITGCSGDYLMTKEVEVFSKLRLSKMDVVGRG